MIFGILKPNRSITEIEKVFISVAHERGHQAYVFCAKDVDFEQRRILGVTLINNVVSERIFEFPVVIQNRLGIKREDVDTYNQLSDIIPFTTNRVGTKKQVYDRIKDIEELKKYLIEVVDLKSIDKFIEYIEKYQKIIAKPAASNQGKGIYTIEKKDQQYIVKYLDELNIVDEEGLKKIFKDDLKQGAGFNFSPFIQSETNLGQSTVFRLHMIRGAEGVWKKIKFFPYVNLNENIDITNGMQGALITTREVLFLEQYYPNAHQKILAGIDALFRVFSKEFQKKYAWSLDALGLDLGITQSGDIYVYEVNAGPGVGFMAYPVACEQILYYEWLAKNAEPPFKHNFLPLHLKHLAKDYTA